jgi:hypothetical protein
LETSSEALLEVAAVLAAAAVHVELKVATFASK